MNFSLVMNENSACLPGNEIGLWFDAGSFVGEKILSVFVSVENR